MGSKFDLPTRSAQNVRVLLGGISEKVPVRYANHRSVIRVLQSHVNGSTALDGLNCAVGKAAQAAGLVAYVGNRKTAVLERDARGREIIYVYANTYIGIKAIAEFDQTKAMMENGFLLWPFPTSWLPEARRKMAKERRKRMSDPNYKPRPYRPRPTNLQTGLKRASF